MSLETLTTIPLTSLPRLSPGKNRISAFDVILKNGIPLKGSLLTQMSANWFQVLSSKIPGLKHHFLSLTPPPAPSVVTPDERRMLHGRSMTVRRMKIFPVEAIVRGYITGSAWAEYQKTQTIHSLPQAAGLLHCQKLPQPIYTPSTKAELGEKDINITPDQAKDIVGEKYASRIEELVLACYKIGAEYAKERGIIIADTKFELGLDEETDEVYIVDEVLTPDSSRFWSQAEYQVGREQDSFDKQPLRNWLIAEGLKGKENTVMPDEIVENTKQRYMDAFKQLTGRTLEEAMESLD